MARVKGAMMTRKHRNKILGLAKERRNDDPQAQK